MEVDIAPETTPSDLQAFLNRVPEDGDVRIRVDWGASVQFVGVISNRIRSAPRCIVRVDLQGEINNQDQKTQARILQICAGEPRNLRIVYNGSNALSFMQLVRWLDIQFQPSALALLRRGSIRFGDDWVFPQQLGVFALKGAIVPWDDELQMVFVRKGLFFFTDEMIEYSPTADINMGPNLELTTTASRKLVTNYVSGIMPVQAPEDFLKIQADVTLRSTNMRKVSQDIKKHLSTIIRFLGKFIKPENISVSGGKRTLRFVNSLGNLDFADSDWPVVSNSPVLVLFPPQTENGPYFDGRNYLEAVLNIIQSISSYQLAERKQTPSVLEFVTIICGLHDAQTSSFLSRRTSKFYPEITTVQWRDLMPILLVGELPEEPTMQLNELAILPCDQNEGEYHSKIAEILGRSWNGDVESLPYTISSLMKPRTEIKAEAPPAFAAAADQVEHDQDLGWMGAPLRICRVCDKPIQARMA